MTPQEKATIRRAAVRMAAKTAAFVVTVGAIGCSGGGKAAPSNVDKTTGGTAGACEPYLAGLATAKPEALPEGDELKTKPGVYGAFQDPAARSAPQTLSCCNADLKAHGAASKHRWACCSAVEGKPDAEVMACTPWGPPCPPEMYS
jgi:hypothetical protein